MYPSMEQRAMPTATLSPFSESEYSDCQFLGPLPPDRVWVPADDLSSALNTLQQLQKKLPAHSSVKPADDIV